MPSLMLCAIIQSMVLLVNQATSAHLMPADHQDCHCPLYTYMLLRRWYKHGRCSSPWAKAAGQSRRITCHDHVTTDAIKQGPNESPYTVLGVQEALSVGMVMSNV